jgi:hypothetical protein
VIIAEESPVSYPRSRRALLAGGVAVVAAAGGWTVAVPSAQAAPVPPAQLAPAPAPAPAPVTTHTVGMWGTQWAVVAVTGGHPTALRQPGGPVLGTSGTSGIHVGNWIAVDHNTGRRTPGTYLLDVTDASGGASGYRVQTVDGSPAVVSGRPTRIGAQAGEWTVDLRQVYLSRGDRLRITLTGDAVSAVNLLHSTATADTWVRNDTQLDTTFWLNKPESTDVTTFTFTAPATAHYALVFERGWWDQTADATLTVLPRLLVPPTQVPFPPATAR